MSGRRFLVVGAGGFIGSKLYARLTPARAVGTFHRRPVRDAVHFDVASMDAAATILDRHPHLSHAFLLHGIGKLDDCARDPEGTGQVNVAGTNRLIDELSRRGIKVVFTSSDAVFDGTRGDWTEDDAPNPVLEYGRQKRAVECHLEATPSPWIIARLSKVVGSDPGDHSLFGEWIRRIDAGEPIPCANDLVFTPIHVEDVVTTLIDLADGPHEGVFNVCGPRSMTRLDLLRLFVDAVQTYRRVTSPIQPCSINDFAMLEPRPLNQAMRTDKLTALLGRGAESMESVCGRIAAAVYGGRAATSLA